MDTFLSDNYIDDDVEMRYRSQVVKRYNHMALTGLSENPVDLTQLALENIFIMLDVEMAQTGNKETLSVAKVLQRHRRLVIAGAPGSGKTTLLRWLAVISASQRQVRMATLGPVFDDTCLPILLELRNLAHRFSRSVPLNLADQIAKQISDTYNNIPTAFIADALAAGRCLLLLDGLDEMAEHARNRLLEALSNFQYLPDQQYSENVVLLSTRPHGYADAKLGSGFRRCTIKPFTPIQISAFVNQWYATAATVPGNSSEISTKAEQLCATIRANSRLLTLATNPLLCRMIITVYDKNEVLPERRAALYKQCCETLLHHWEEEKGIQLSEVVGEEKRWKIAMKRLEPLAFWLHSEGERFVAPHDAWVTQLANWLQERNKQLDDEAARVEANTFFIDIRDRGGLLQDGGNGTLQFVHPTFQEYLAARYIAAQPEPYCIDLVMKDLHKVWWQEVHLLVIGHLGQGDSKEEEVEKIDVQKVERLLQTILHQTQPPGSWWRAFTKKPQTQRWIWQLLYRFGDNRLLKWPVRTLCLPFLAPTLFARWLSYWQLNAQVEWALERNFTLAAIGFLECTEKGRSESLKSSVQKAAIHRLLAVVNDFLPYVKPTVGIVRLHGWREYTHFDTKIEFLIKLFQAPIDIEYVVMQQKL
ncbi:MAG: NACHT domain-containing protein [Caldilineaceae bacterium]